MNTKAAVQQLPPVSLHEAVGMDHLQLPVGVLEAQLREAEEAAHDAEHRAAYAPTRSMRLQAEGDRAHYESIANARRAAIEASGSHT